MKKITLILIVLAYSSVLCAQVFNVNPNPIGDPWLAGGTIIPTKEDLQRIPKLTSNFELENLSLPIRVDNSKLKFFPQVFNQKGGSCAQAAAVGYCLTYEMNRARNTVPRGRYDITPINQTENLFAYLYTYNMLTSYSDEVPPGESGSYISSGFELVLKNGCPLWNVFMDSPHQNIESPSFLYWMSGFEKYLGAMHNRIKSYKRIQVSPKSSGLDTLKLWLANHAIGDNSGGLVVFSQFVTTPNPLGGDDLLAPHSTFPDNSECAGEMLFTEWGPTGGHAMTIVGYNDNLKYDFNGDGLFTRDIDINGDGIIDLYDSEFGAFKVANSWGPDFGNEGFIWVPYRLMIDAYEFLVCDVDEDYKPKLAAKVIMTHPRRGNLMLSVGSAPDSNFDEPYMSKIYRFNGSSNFPMQGVSSDPIEFGFDFGDSHTALDFGKGFLSITDNGSDHTYSGRLNSFSIMDYRKENPVEFEYPKKDILIPVGRGRLDLSLNYFLLPDTIAVNTEIISDRVILDTVVFTNNCSVNLAKFRSLEMYNATLIVENNSKLTIADYAVISGKKGDNHVFIYGDVSLGKHLKFEAAIGSKLTVHFLNTNDSVVIDQANIVNADIQSSSSFVLSNSHLFKARVINKGSRSVEIRNNTFSESNFSSSGVYSISAPQNLNHSPNVVVRDNVFSGRMVPGSAVNLVSCNSFLIENNRIEKSERHGISIMYCSNGFNGNSYSNVIRNNVVSNCGISNTEQARFSSGILLYNSAAQIFNNTCFDNNGDGISVLASSSASVVGVDCFEDNLQMQNITNNSVHQVSASTGSFPYPFRYNFISASTSNPYSWVNSFDPNAFQSKLLATYNSWAT